MFPLNPLCCAVTCVWGTPWEMLAKRRKKLISMKTKRLTFWLKKNCNWLKHYNCLIQKYLPFTKRSVEMKKKILFTNVVLYEITFIKLVNV